MIDEAFRRRLDKVLEGFGDVLTDETGLTDVVEMEIDTGGVPPVHECAYNTPLSVREKVTEEIQGLSEKGYIRESQSPWASPIVTVKKSYGAIRLCVDYKKVNTVTGPGPFYMPTVEETMEVVAKASVISTIDLNMGYYQVRVAEHDIQKTALVCRDGHFEFTRMSFGLKNSPAVFQKLTSMLMARCRRFAVPYIDDIVIFSNSWEHHLGHVEIVLSVLKGTGRARSSRSSRIISCCAPC